MGLRQEKLADEVRDILAECFSGERLRDPRVQSVTITHVKLTKDLQIATVYYRMYEGANQQELEQGLESCKGFLRKTLADVLKVRRVPDLRFVYDESVEYGSRIEYLLTKI